MHMQFIVALLVVLALCGGCAGTKNNDSWKPPVIGGNDKRNSSTNFTNQTKSSKRSSSKLKGKSSSMGYGGFTISTTNPSMSSGGFTISTTNPSMGYGGVDASTVLSRGNSGSQTMNQNSSNYGQKKVYKSGSIEYHDVVMELIGSEAQQQQYKENKKSWLSLSNNQG
uniref:Uncharacterized protein n=1 Tax=Globodera rostochiensis TaxID=31243 RepID=A0A914H816_GLORO